MFDLDLHKQKRSLPNDSCVRLNAKVDRKNDYAGLGYVSDPFCKRLFSIV